MASFFKGSVKWFWLFSGMLAMLAMFIACCLEGGLVVFVFAPLAFSQDGLVPHLHCAVLLTLT